MIEALEGFGDNIGAFACHGHVTKADYDTVLIPGIEEILKHHDKVRIYYQFAEDFDSIDPGAMWEDTKVGVSHLMRWERFAVITDVDWIKHAVKLFGFLMPGDLKVFPLAEASQARAWITEAAPQSS